MKKYNFILLYFTALLSPIYSMACDDNAYIKFKNTQIELKKNQASDDQVYNRLKKASEDIDVFCPEADNVVSDARNKVYSYIQSGVKIKASNIYDCNSMSIESKCINKYYSDWDWTSRAYPRSTLKLMRPYLHSGESINFRDNILGERLLYIRMVYDVAGIEHSLPIEFSRIHRNNDYVSAIIPDNINNLISHTNIENCIISNSWLVVIYKGTKGFLKVVWYY